MNHEQIQKIERLASLKKDGDLSEEEFQAQKTKILEEDKASSGFFFGGTAESRYARASWTWLKALSPKKRIVVVIGGVLCCSCLLGSCCLLGGLLPNEPTFEKVEKLKTGMSVSEVESILGWGEVVQRGSSAESRPTVYRWIGREHVVTAYFDSFESHLYSVNRITRDTYDKMIASP